VLIWTLIWWAIRTKPPMPKIRLIKISPYQNIALFDHPATRNPDALYMKALHTQALYMEALRTEALHDALHDALYDALHGALH
jgi:hypothetical protein